MEPVDLDEEDEVEMTVGELQSWIRQQVENNELLRLRQTQLAQVKSLVERRELQAASTRALFKRTCQAVVECESSLKDLYCELDINYRDTDSEGDESSTSDVIEMGGGDDAAPNGGTGYSRSVVECETTVKDLYHQLGLDYRYGDPKRGENVSSSVIEIDSDRDDATDLNDDAMPVYNVAAPEIVTASESGGEQQRPGVPERNQGSPDEQSGPVEKGAGGLQQRSLQTHLSCGAMEIDSQSIHILPSEATSAVNTIPTEVTASASRHPATHIETAAAKEPNDSYASSEEIPPQRKGSSRLAARLSKIKPQHEVAVQRKLPESVISSGTIGQTKPERRLNEEESSSSDDSDASWEPSDSERDPGPRAKRRARDAPRKHQSSDKGPTSAKPQKDNMEMKTPTVNRSSSTSSTKPQETNKGSSCVVTPHSNTATQPPVRPPTPNTATQRPAGPPTPNPATQPPAGPPTPNPATQPPAGLPEEVIKVGMVVLAGRRISTWHQGKIVEIKPVEKGHKYKVDFEEHGKSWMSGHHIAFLPPPLLEHLYEGARVVAMYKEPEGDQSWFYSGTLAELPNRKNQSRFLVFFDDGTPSYVRLPVLHLVCRPLQHGTPSWEEDIEDERYRDFLLYYLNEFPNQPMAHYNVGQQINVDYNSVHKRCRVETIDCSLLHVLFLDDQHKEWVYRGSMRLQHMANMKKKRESSVCKTGESSTATTSKVTDSNSSRAQC